MKRMSRATARMAKCAAALAAGFGLVAANGPARAEEWPSRSVSVLVSTAAGGNTDLMARFAADHLNKVFGQPFVVQNRPSAGGILTTQQVATADPDGYTLLFAPAAVVLLTPLVQQVPFDPSEKLIPITNVGTGSQVVAVKASLPVKTLAEFLAYAKANPGKLNFAAAGVNNISHLGPVLMFKRSGVELAMVAERGEPQAITDLTNGSIDFYFGNASVLLNSDLQKIRLLAVATPQRIAAAPDMPTAAETLPGFVFGSWNGLFAPVGTPAAVIAKIRTAVAEFVRSPEMSKRLVNLGIVPGGQSADEVAATFKADRLSFAEAVKAAGIVKPQ